MELTYSRTPLNGFPRRTRSSEGVFASMGTAPVPVCVFDRSVESMDVCYEQGAPAFDDLVRHSNFAPDGCTLVRPAFINSRGILFSQGIAKEDDHEFRLQFGPDGVSVSVPDHIWDFGILSRSKPKADGSERLRSESRAFGWHRKKAHWPAHIRGLVQGIHRWKGWHVSGEPDSRVNLAEAASLMQSPRATFIGAAGISRLNTVPSPTSASAPRDLPASAWPRGRCGTA